MERGSELIHLQTSWAMGTLDNVLNICKELNFPLIWYDAKHEVPAALQIGAFYLSALLLKGELYIIFHDLCSPLLEFIL